MINWHLRLQSVAHSSDALRNTMLIAGLHYAWNAGQLQSYEPTFLFHKIQTMSDVNKFLQNSDTKYAVCVRNISTLCFSEVICLYSPLFEADIGWRF